jgi:hypothetical protein
VADLKRNCTTSCGASRAALLSKLGNLSEYDRRPMTPTGTNLLAAAPLRAHEIGVLRVRRFASSSEDAV